VDLINIAGNEVSLFLFRFELRGNGIDFVLNAAIAEVMLFSDARLSTSKFHMTTN
jgi:hypothetical protein